MLMLMLMLPSNPFNYSLIHHSSSLTRICAISSYLADVHCLSGMAWCRLYSSPSIPYSPAAYIPSLWRFGCAASIMHSLYLLILELKCLLHVEVELALFLQALLLHVADHSCVHGLEKMC